MQEGWSGEQHFILFNTDEALEATHRYGIEAVLPGYRVVGLHGWDDFILANGAGALFTVPTVPVATEYLKPLSVALPNSLLPDSAHAGRIKWYLQPVAFGGSPVAGPNIQWVDHAQHAELVRWWNQVYVEASKRA